MTDDTAAIQAEYLTLRSVQNGDEPAPADETPESRRAREARISALYDELQARSALPRHYTTVPGFQ